MKKIKKDIRGEKKEKLPLVKGYTAKDDIKAVMKQYNLPERFSKVVLDEAKRIESTGVEWKKDRLDLLLSGRVCYSDMDAQSFV